MSQYRPLYRRKAKVQREEEKVAIQYIVSQERNLQGMIKYIATRLGVSQDRSEAEIPAQKKMSCNTQDCIARQSTEDRRSRAEIHQIMLQATAIAQEGKRVYRKTNLSLAIQSHTKQLKAVIRCKNPQVVTEKKTKKNSDTAVIFQNKK